MLPSVEAKVVPKEAEFLEYNRDEIFKNLLAIEGHLRNLSDEGYDAEYYSCIIKHLADAESHADEAISHSLIVSGEGESENYTRLRDMIRVMRKRFQSEPPRSKAAMVEVRRIRRFFESFNKPFDTSKCISCEIHTEKEHEKPLYSSSQGKNPDSKMAWRETGVLVGGVHIGKGVTIAADYVDVYTGMCTAPLEQKPSTWINLLGGTALILLPRFYKRFSPTVDTLMTVVGGFMTTKVWDYAQQLLPSATAAPVATPARVTPQTVAPVPIARGKYRVTG